MVAPVLSCNILDHCSTRVHIAVVHIISVCIIFVCHASFDIESFLVSSSFYQVVQIWTIWLLQTRIIDNNYVTLMSLQNIIITIF